ILLVHVHIEGLVLDDLPHRSSHFIETCKTFSSIDHILISILGSTVLHIFLPFAEAVVQHFVVLVEDTVEISSRLLHAVHVEHVVPLVHHIHPLAGLVHGIAHVVEIAHPVVHHVHWIRSISTCTCLLELA